MDHHHHGGPPQFTGYTTAESVLTFIEDFEQYAASRTLTVTQQNILLPTCLKGPAKTNFITATIAGADNVLLTNCKTWLRTNYYMEDIKQAMKDQLDSLCQGISEDPNTFYI